MIDIVKFVFGEDEEWPNASSKEYYVKIDTGDQQIDYEAIEDAISSYIDAVDSDTSCTELIEDVLESFEFDSIWYYKADEFPSFQRFVTPSYVFTI